MGITPPASRELDSALSQPEGVVMGLAETDGLLARCYPVMRQLRPHLAGKAEFMGQVRRQQAAGFHLGYLECAGEIRSLVGYRFVENLAWGHHCYLDDFVSDEAVRGGGLGQLLFGWLLERVREAGCKQLHLDSGVQRHGAHRFYLASRMDITCHHFAREVGGI